MRIARVFPRRTKATPTDPLAYVGPPDLYAEHAEADEVHVSVTFSWDKPAAERLAEAWRHVAPVKIGGVAYGDKSLEFIPDRYIKRGYTVTSRGCPRNCWFCDVPKKWPTVNPMPIYDGWNVLDDNLLAAPEWHVRAVFEMLRRQTPTDWPECEDFRIEFTGGLEALALQDYQVDLLASLRPKPKMFWAYDPGDAFETLELAARKMLAAGFTAASHRLQCYVLIGYPRDTFALAEARLRQMVGIGFTPMAMLWSPSKASQEKWRPAPEWKRFQRQWARPAIIHRVEAVDPKPKTRVFILQEVGV